MNNTSSEETEKRSFEQIPKLAPPPPGASGGSTPSGSEVVAAWKKGDAPTAPPGEIRRPTPPWADPILTFVGNIVGDEALVLDLCYEKACEVVDWNFSKGLVGSDHFEGEKSAGPRALVCGIAGPLSVELYRQVLASLNGDKKTEFEAVVKAALEKKDAPTIITP